MWFVKENLSIYTDVVGTHDRWDEMRSAEGDDDMTMGREIFCIFNISSWMNPFQPVFRFRTFRRCTALSVAVFVAHQHVRPSVLVKDSPHCKLAAVKPDCETRKRIIKIAPIVCTATVFVRRGGGRRRTKLSLSQWAVVRLAVCLSLCLSAAVFISCGDYGRTEPPLPRLDELSVTFSRVETSRVLTVLLCLHQTPHRPLRRADTHNS